jgi:hypothetical protein
MQIAALRAVGRVKIGMCIKPQHEQRAAKRRRMRRHSGDGAQRQRMIAAHEDRKPLCRRGAARLGQRLGPADGFGQMMHRRIGMGPRRMRHRRHIAPVDHAMP